MSTEEQNIDYFLLTFAVNCKSKCMWRKIGISLSFISTGVLKPERKKNILVAYYSGASYLFEIRKNVSSRKHVSCCLQPSSHYCKSTSSHCTLCHLLPKNIPNSCLMTLATWSSFVSAVGTFE